MRPLSKDDGREVEYFSTGNYFSPSRLIFHTAERFLFRKWEIFSGMRVRISKV